MTMKLRSFWFAAAAGALALAACGSGDDDSANAAPGTSAGGGSDTVSVASVEGIGDVLVDSSGMPLYTADEEVAAGNQVLCITDSCTAFWVPLEPGANAPTAGPGVPELGVAERPDGTEQVTAGGKLLYTFSQDSPGNVTGDGFEDDFDGQHLTWHAVHVDGSGGITTDTSTDGSTGGTSGGGSPGYDYGG
jgi:predicted lipoprotein with Yx(FWY)xxD motif